MKQLETPIAFIIFNRPDTTQRVFNEIRKAQPKRLFVISDGARSNDERTIVEETRKIIDQIDWSCEIHKNYSSKNLGCKIRVSSGIDWFFDNVEQGIILEDDCLPSQSFFWFCEELLEKYKNNEKIAMISGDNFQDGIQRSDDSYYFSLFSHIWGWATWKRAWKYYDVKMKDYPGFKKENRIYDFWKDPIVRRYWINIFDNVYKNKIDTWDYQWTYAIWKQGGLCITPNINMIKNIGFGPDATHTKTDKNRKMVVETLELNLLVHPESIVQNKEADDYSINRFEINIPTTKENFIKKFLKKF